MTADGPYQAKNFSTALFGNSQSEHLCRVHWDAAHWWDLLITDVRDGKIGDGLSKDIFAYFIERANTFASHLNRGKGKFDCIAEVPRGLTFVYSFISCCSIVFFFIYTQPFFVICMSQTLMS